MQDAHNDATDTPDSAVRIAIFGIGAMGCWFGSRLSGTADVTLIGSWPEQLRALRNSRLRIIYPDGGEELTDMQVRSTVEGMDPVDVALIATKSVRTEEAAEAAAMILKPEGIAVTVQNGLGNYEIMARHVGAERAVLGVTTQGAATDGPGLLRYAGGGDTHLSTHPAAAGMVKTLAQLLTAADLPVVIAQDVSSLVWGKLAINCAINPLTAILRVPNGALIESEWARAIMRNAALEVAEVAEAQGIPLPYKNAAKRAEEVAEATASNRSSMLQDVLRGAPTEIDAICGAVSQVGEELGVRTPTNKLLWRLIKGMEELGERRL